MSLITTEDQQTIRTIFAERLDGDVTVTYFTQRESSLIVPSPECEYCAATRSLLEEVCALSDKIRLEIKDFVADAAEARVLGVTRIPAFVLRGQVRRQVRFFGIPAGYEFGSLIEALIDASTGTTDLTEKTRRVLATLDHDLHLQVFVTPTCPYCPQAVRLAHKLAVENAHVIADAVEATEFPELANRYQVYGVPKTVVNEDLQFEGALPEARLIEELFGALAPDIQVVSAGRV